MDSMTLTILAGVLAVVGVGGILFAIFAGSFAAEKRRSKRLAAIQEIGQQRRSESQLALQRAMSAQSASQARIKELTDKEREKKRRRFDISSRLVQADVSMSATMFILMFQGIGLATAVVAMLFDKSPLVAGLMGLTVAFGGPRLVLQRMIARRQRKFIEHLANAIDIMVRGVRSGLPVNESMKIIANEIPDPVRGEFRRLVDTISVGVTLEDGLNRMFDRMPIPEVNFFRTVLVIQKQTGGNLAEALSNLSEILRARKRLKGKIRALSSEARSSAIIIGSLPFIVGLMVYFVSPDYINLLFTDPRGPYLIAAGLVWMGCGIFMMRSMINFQH